MKKAIHIFVFSFILNSISAQVNCNMTFLTTIQNFDVYEHIPSGAIMYRAKMAIDADGSPRAYGPNDSGLDFTANGGSPGNWWGVVTDNNGDPIIQGSSDPYPGMYVSTTSLVNSSYPSTNPLRYANSEALPFFVLPLALVQLTGVTLGDMGYVYNTQTGLGCYAIFADGGPAGKLGEGSIYLANQIGVNSNARTGGTTQGIIDYIVFPGTGFGQGTIPSISQINSLAGAEISAVGGTGITSCLNSPSPTCGTPANLSSSNINPTTVTLSWGPVTAATSYTIQYKKTTASTWTTITSTSTSTTISGLTAATGYQFKVLATCTVAGAYSATSTFTTDENVDPTTAISVVGNWETNDFTATFTDADNGGSGLEKSFYQVIDYDGTEWHANANNGFFADNFDSYNTPVWSVPSGSGTWLVNNGKLIQTDTSVSNSNIYAALNQNLSNRYLYNFYATMDAAADGANQHRFGFHFHSDNAALTNRGNSYFMFVRQETSVIELYKVVNNTFTLVKTISNITTAFGQGYDYKIIFDRTSGKIDIYRDNTLLGSWTDSSVLTTSGDYISFRTGNCKVEITELKVYRSRAATVTVSVGPGATNDIRFQNPSPAMYSGKIKSIVNDAAGNLSAIAYQNVYVNWTPPSCTDVNDGLAIDTDTTGTLSALSANWGAVADTNSGVSHYMYAIGTSAGATDVVNWTNNNNNTSVTASGLSLTAGQTYYVSVKVTDSAGLSSICTSDGIIADEPIQAGIEENANKIQISAQPNPFDEVTTIYFSVKAEQNVSLVLTDVVGKIVMQTNRTYATGTHNIAINSGELQLSKGMYTLKVYTDTFSTSLKLIKY